MLTPEEVRAIPLFSVLEAKELENLARTSEDIQLRPGDFAVHEGGERAAWPSPLSTSICSMKRTLG
jgi:thioredoxin reductase (NADPH)